MDKIKAALEAAKVSILAYRPKDRPEKCPVIHKIDEALQLLDTHVVVPKEPTEERIEAGQSCRLVGAPKFDVPLFYKAMTSESEGHN